MSTGQLVNSLFLANHEGNGKHRRSTSNNSPKGHIKDLNLGITVKKLQQQSLYQ